MRRLRRPCKPHAIHRRYLETSPRHRPGRSRRGAPVALWRQGGRVTFTADGRMMSIVCDGRKELPGRRQPGIQPPIAVITPMMASGLSRGLTRPDPDRQRSGARDELRGQRMAVESGSGGPLTFGPNPTFGPLLPISGDPVCGGRGALDIVTPHPDILHAVPGPVAGPPQRLR